MIRVLIVEDSVIMCQILAKELSKFADIEVIGYANNPYIARDKIVELQPDVITLDIEMPRMDGISFLAKLMKYFPLPIIIVSSLTPQNSEKALQALELGAIEVICKPQSNNFNEEFIRKLILAIRTSALVQVSKLQESENKAKFVRNLTVTQGSNKIIAIGASTGGTKAIEKILRDFPVNCPATIIVQHLPEGFSSHFAHRLSKSCPAIVSQAVDYDLVIPGKVLIAPGNRHIILEKDNNSYYVRIKEGPAVHFHRPSIDVLFYSVARSAGSNSIGVILTGMGADGAKGLLAMQKKGAFTLAQDKEDCIVFGMPKEAINLGAASLVVPLCEMSEVILTVEQIPQLSANS